MDLFIKGTVEAIFFQNPSNFYKVVLISIEETNTAYLEKEIVVTGTLGQIQPEATYTFFGQIVEHAKYGQQFQVVRYQQDSLSSQKGLVQYLSSDKFPGIGTVLATRLVDMFGEETISKIVQNVPELMSIQGLTTQKREMLIDTLTELQGENQTILGLLKYGLTDKHAYRIFQVYREKSVQYIEQNPYALLENIEGIGFNKLDQIAEQLGFAPDARERLSGAIYVTLRDLCYATGYTYQTPIDLLKQTVILLEKNQRVLVNEQLLVDELGQMIQVGKIIEDNGRMALPSIYYAENGIVTSIKGMLNQEDVTYPKINLSKEIKAVEKELSIQYSKEQKEAIIKAVTSPISILTGGPGTGKTTVLNGLVYLFAKLNDISLKHAMDKSFPILLAAPTGRAAKRMKELTGLPAVTIHRLLGIGLTGENLEPTDTYIQTLEGALLIIDEMSMVDTWLMNWLLNAVPMGMQVVLVGDKHQLPSVGPGQVLHDLLKAEVVPYTELRQVYRQDESSTIISLAHHIKDGVLPDTFTQNFPDRSFFSCTASQVPMIIEKVVERAKQRGYSMKDIQVLAPSLLNILA